MTATELKQLAVSLNGKSYGAQLNLAGRLGVDVSTVRRWMVGTIPVPGPVEVAVKAMVAEKGH